MNCTASNSAFIYLDEAGDLGWKFDAPYRKGGSSRFLTIASICTPEAKKHLPKRAVRGIFTRFGWSPSTEHKWSSLNSGERSACAASLKQLCSSNPDIFAHAIVVKKENVFAHIRDDANKLYNFMIRLSLLDRMAICDLVTLIPDPRSIKVKSGNSLHDYLQTELWFTQKSHTKLFTCPQDSSSCKGIQLADYLAGIVQAHFEDGESADYELIRSHLTLHRLYF